MYGAQVSPSLISTVTDAVVDEVTTWQARPLGRVYPIVYMDCIHVKGRDGAVRIKAAYLAIGQSWRRNWSRLTPFFEYPREIRKGDLQDQRDRVGQDEPA
jgi:transposase-like protein